MGAVPQVSDDTVKPRAKGQASSRASAGPSRGQVPARPKSLWRRPAARREALAGYLYLAPWIIGFLLLTAYPLLASLYYSFTHYPLLGGPTWAGLDNYRELADDPTFWKSLRITAIFVAFVVPGTVIVGYAIALLLNQKVRLVRVWRTVYFLPSIMPAIAAAFLWLWVFNGRFGVVNGVLAKLGIQGPLWFGSEDWVLPAFIIMSLWTSGGSMILYLAAIQRVPQSLYDAAKVDGASAWRRLIHVTLPMTSPVILFTFVTGMIGSFQVFTAAYIITQGGPNDASLFYVLLLYRTGWQGFQMGYASAMAWVLTVILMGLTAVTFLIARKAVYYEFDAGGRR